MQLVYLENGKEAPYTLSSIVAECAEVQHHTVTRLIRKHKSSLNKFGKVGFKIQASESGQKEKDYKLNESQATLLITFMRNTPKVIEFKEALVKEFYQMREQIKHFEVQREIEKVIHKELNEAIKNWEHMNAFSYSNIGDLLCRSVTGISTTKLRERESASKSIPALDLMDGDELTKYREQATRIIMYLNQGLTYQEIKNQVMK
ncbi:Rha family transcriptional regulator [Aerococcus sanguinicola]|uniref:Rha family transcriptional regulator n=1 Tax=unclassified Aerococcus TaxID=2618060 RepID=UPI0008A60945|nr:MULTISPECIES: Rha family transcriptional regulator [unclassified Aerococcus]OFN02422.1 hypothetical protein HMPREF2626_06150 [Aerococcus sp. HMSC062A02]OHO45153.1 hypothetical protein HMPREF2705_01005 [Aerococcus sp. HMSC035B07]